jgi:hypothetical protein
MYRTKYYEVIVNLSKEINVSRKYLHPELPPAVSLTS